MDTMLNAASRLNFIHFYQQNFDVQWDFFNDTCHRAEGRYPLPPSLYVGNKMQILAAIHWARTHVRRLAITWSKADGCTDCRHARNALSEEQCDLSDKIMFAVSGLCNLLSTSACNKVKPVVKRKTFYWTFFLLNSHPTRWWGGPCRWAGPESCP
jgi:hypothetical protein